MYNYKNVTSPKDMPTEDHYAIIIFDSYSSDDGYPEDGTTQHPYVRYQAYKNRGDWEKDLEKLTLDTSYGRKEVRGIFVKAVKTKVTTTFEVNEK